jgi:hypothetical protein
MVKVVAFRRAKPSRFFAQSDPRFPTVALLFGRAIRLGIWHRKFAQPFKESSRRV